MRRFDLKIIVFFVLLTLLLTIGVIVFWEKTLRPPFFAWVDARYPGEANVERRWNVKQRVEHVFISITVDALVVTLLLRLVHRQQRQLRASEERYRALFEQARDGIGVVRLSDHHLVEANNKVCEILGLPRHDCVNQNILELFRTSTPHAQSQLLMSSNGHSSVESELVIQTPQGGPRPVAVSFTPISTSGEEVMLMSMHDLSARKKLEAEREEMQRQLYQSSKLAS